MAIQDSRGSDRRDLIEIAKNLYQSDVDSAYTVAQDVLSESIQKNDYHAASKSNVILGHIHYLKRREYGKAIIYYLEAIRYYSKTTDSNEDLDLDLIQAFKNCGIVFRKFKSYDLAKEYYHKGLDLAIKSRNDEEIISLNYNLSSVYGDLRQFDESTRILSMNLEKTDNSAKLYFYLLNRLGFHYHKWGKFDLSINILKRALEEVDNENILMKGYLNQNLAKSYRSKKEFDKALEHYAEAIELKSRHGDGSSAFSSLYGSGEVYLEKGDYDIAKKYFKKAESLLSNFKLNPDYFNLHKVQANLYYLLNDYEKSKHYEDLYDKRMSEYLEVQQEIQETDQRYNMDLITKRYFAEVEKQEQIASIMMYSQIISGGLLFLLFAVIGYFRYEKVKLRKSIERELVSLRLVD